MNFVIISWFFTPIWQTSLYHVITCIFWFFQLMFFIIDSFIFKHNDNRHICSLLTVLVLFHWCLTSLYNIVTGQLYGLEKFWAFLKYSRKHVDVDPKLKQWLSKYKRLEDFRVDVSGVTLRLSLLVVFNNELIWLLLTFSFSIILSIFQSKFYFVIVLMKTIVYWYVSILYMVFILVCFVSYVCVICKPCFHGDNQLILYESVLLFYWTWVIIYMEI